MNVNKNILLILLITAIFLILLFVIDHEEKPENDDLMYYQIKTIEEKDMNSNLTIVVSKDVCEGCHMSGKLFIPQAMIIKPHINGGAYCLRCHKISHEVHPKDDKNVTCEKCHGNSPEKPSFINGSITCNNCHNYPDPLIESNGNLIVIHRPRGITCNNCHTDQCNRCHPDVGIDKRWDKRMTHFRTILI